MKQSYDKSSRRDALKKLIQGSGILGFKEAILGEEKENPEEENMKKAAPEDILNDWEHLLEDE